MADASKAYKPFGMQKCIRQDWLPTTGQFGPVDDLQPALRSIEVCREHDEVEPTPAHCGRHQEPFPVGIEGEPADGVPRRQRRPSAWLSRPRACNARNAPALRRSPCARQGSHTRSESCSADSSVRRQSCSRRRSGGHLCWHSAARRIGTTRPTTQWHRQRISEGRGPRARNPGEGASVILIEHTSNSACTSREPAIGIGRSNPSLIVVSVRLPGRTASTMKRYYRMRWQANSVTGSYRNKSATTIQQVHSNNKLPARRYASRRVERVNGWPFSFSIANNKTSPPSNRGIGHRLLKLKAMLI